MLYTREFTVNGQKIIVGHDRETGKRYFCTEVLTKIDIQEIAKDLYPSDVYADWEQEAKIEELKSIFWIK